MLGENELQKLLKTLMTRDKYLSYKNYRENLERSGKISNN